jgi:hypothetical protein
MLCVEERMAPHTADEESIDQWTRNVTQEGIQAMPDEPKHIQKDEAAGYLRLCA